MKNIIFIYTFLGAHCTLFCSGVKFLLLHLPGTRLIFLASRGQTVFAVKYPSMRSCTSVLFNPQSAIYCSTTSLHFFVGLPIFKPCKFKCNGLRRSYFYVHSAVLCFSMSICQKAILDKASVNVYFNPPNIMQLA